MNAEKFQSFLLSLSGAKIVTIHAETIPPMRKTDNPYLGTVKRAAVNGVINWIYESAVNRQRLREDKTPDFTAFPRKWGQRLQGTPLVEHKGKYYLEMKVQKSECKYFLGEQEVSKEEIKPFLRPIAPTRQEVDKEVILRDYSLENITAIIYNQEAITVA